MTSLRLKHWMVSLALVASFPVSAQLDATFRAAVVHAGPDPAFPQVTSLPAAANVHVVGCVSNRQWCDIQSGRTRGWIRVGDVRVSAADGGDAVATATRLRARRGRVAAYIGVVEAAGEVVLDASRGRVSTRTTGARLATGAFAFVTALTLSLIHISEPTRPY